MFLKHVVHWQNGWVQVITGGPGCWNRGDLNRKDLKSEKNLVNIRTTFENRKKCKCKAGSVRYSSKLESLCLSDQSLKVSKVQCMKMALVVRSGKFS